MTLKLAAGFSVAEIARALLRPNQRFQKKITRAKEIFVTQTIRWTVLLIWIGPNVLPKVQHTIYLIFNEGYLSLTPDHSLRRTCAKKRYDLPCCLIRPVLVVVRKTVLLSR